jgi:hypothetical protein
MNGFHEYFTQDLINRCNPGKVEKWPVVCRYLIKPEDADACRQQNAET